MKYRLYQLLVPEFIRERIYYANVQQYQESEQERLKVLAESVTQVELSSAYITSLRMLIDGNALLNAMPKETVVAQVGVGKGDFSAKILLIAKPKKLYLIDRFPADVDGSYEILQRKFRREIALGQVVVHNGDPVDELMSHQDAYFNWVYLSTDSSPESLSSILEICKRKVTVEGIIAGNNYGRVSCLGRTEPGVVDAVHRFCKRHAWEMIYLTHEPSRQLSYAIRKVKLSGDFAGPLQ